MSSLAVERLTPDFSGHSDLVVMLLGMKATSCRGLITLVSLLARRAVSKSIRKRPDGLLFAQNSVLYSPSPIPCWISVVLARSRKYDGVGAFCAAPVMVGFVLKGYAWNVFLARDLLHARRYGSDVRQHGHR